MKRLVILLMVVMPFTMFASIEVPVYATDLMIKPTKTICQKKVVLLTAESFCVPIMAGAMTWTAN